MDFSVVLFDNNPYRDSLLPLVATRPICDLRVGLLTIMEKWELLLPNDVSCLTLDYLQSKFPMRPNHNTILAIDSALLPCTQLVDLVLDLELNCCLVDKSGRLIAVKTSKQNLSLIHSNRNDFFSIRTSDAIFSRIQYPEDIFELNAREISKDISLLNLQKSNSVLLDKSNFLGVDIYIDESSKIEYATIDARQGPVVIGANVIIEPGVFLKGPVAVGEGTRIKSGSTLYPNISIGPNCTIAGELNNVVIWGNSAKGHEGYLGCAVIGEGCNLGAGTTNSNLKNDWSFVKLYDYSTMSYRDTGKTKCGVIIGDHVMLGIQSKINTGTVIGVGAQIAMSNFIPKFVPDFSWVTDVKNEPYLLSRFEQMMYRKSAMKNENLEETDVGILKQVYFDTKELRNIKQY